MRGDNRSHARNSGGPNQPENGQQRNERGSFNVNNQGIQANNYNHLQRYGTSSDTEEGRTMGAELPSRFVVIERVRKEKTSDDMRNWITRMNSNVEIRSLKRMSHSNSVHKRFILEVSLKHIDIVMKNTFWPENVKTRPFKGNGNSWSDKDLEGVEDVLNDDMH